MPAHTTACWTFDIPGEAAGKWLATRKGPDGDEQEFRNLLKDDPGARMTPACLSVLRCDGDGDTEGTGHVSSGLTWHEPRGFEPPDTRVVSFIPVPNDEFRNEVAHRLESEDGLATVTQPLGGVKWQRWYGGTRGVADDSAGVESSATGSTSCQFNIQRAPGRVFLANVHTCGPKTRLTFARLTGSRKYLPAVYESTLQLLETPVEPWLPRLTAGATMASFVPDLRSGLTNGTVEVLHTEVCALRDRWKREDDWPWCANADYINPSIHNQKLCFNPRSITNSIPACRMELENGGDIFSAQVCGEPVRQKFGLWLPEVKGSSAGISTLSLSAWPQFTLRGHMILPKDRDMLLHASLGRAWRHPEKAALHWLMMRSTRIAGEAAITPEAMKAKPPTASFTITSGDGKILAHVTLPADAVTLEDGRVLQSLEPRKVDPEHYFQEAVPREAREAAKSLDGQPSIATMLDGVQAGIENGGWTLEHSLAPARQITETLIAMTEQPAGDDYRSEPVQVSCDRLVLKREKLIGLLPAPGDTKTQALDGGRTLTVRVNE